ncbi:SixA phosphatase family protein [Thioclava sp. GXIMD4215]|uniref:SixA phosphatase family protein n=1 Tax=Thioclava sp. GXIMD4215 TaxID=3131928 RepID=UPI003250B2FA
MTTPAGYRRLILTRHAKSSWDDPTQDDFDRPLNQRGRFAATELGDFLASRGLEPEEVLCSPAARTKETWARVKGAVLESLPAEHFIPELYQANAAQLLATLRQAHMPTVMMLAHNPGIADFAASLPARVPLSSDFRRYVTCATLVVDFQIDSWAELKPGGGSVIDFFTPSRRG